MSTFIFLFIFFLSVFFNPLVCVSANVQDHIFSGSKFVQEKKYKEAVREFETAVTLDPDNSEANLLLGLALAQTGDLENAILYCSKSVSITPSYSGFYNMGLIYSNQDHFDKASEAYTKALEQNPKSYQAWHQLGKVYASSLNFEKAVHAYQQAAELNPKFPEAYQGMGSAYYWSGDLTAALKQVDMLNKMNFQDKALELENWIKNKEAKKQKASKKSSK